MTKITFIESNNAEHSVEARIGRSLMQVAVDNMIPGVDGECGGACSCATCHLYIDEAWAAKLPPASSDERFMLEGAEAVTERSRLGCQLKVREEWDGLVVRIPAVQG